MGISDYIKIRTGTYFCVLFSLKQLFCNQPNFFFDPNLTSKMNRMRTKRHVSNVNANDSPDTKRRKIQMRRDVQVRAFNELLSRKNANGGKKTYGDVSYIVEKYSQCGCEKFVTRKNLEYRYKQYIDGKFENNLPECIDLNVPECINGVPECINLGSLTDVLTIDTAQFHLDNVVTNNNTENIVSQSGGRKKGSTVSAKQQYLQNIGDATTHAAIKFNDIRGEAKRNGLKVPNGTLAKVITETEELYKVAPGTLSARTIIYRVEKKNLNGSHCNRTSPLHEIEPFIVDCIIRSYKICHAMTKTDIILLTQEIISGTIYEERLKECKELRKIEKRTKMLGDAWFRGFMRRNRDKLRRSRVKVKDDKRHTWCTYENFDNMYDRVYEAMVDAMVAKHCEEEMMV